MVVNGAIVRVSTPQQQPPASVEPEGWAAAFVEATGDASGGVIEVNALSEGGFLYRLESVTLVGSGVTGNGRLTLFPRWLAEGTGLGIGNLLPSFSMADYITPTASRNGLIQGNPMAEIKRIPLGVGRSTGTQTIARIGEITNTNTETYGGTFIFTYWRISAASRLGWIEAFMEAPR